MVLTSKHGDALSLPKQDKKEKSMREGVTNNGFGRFLKKVVLPVFRRYKTKNGAKTQINGYASFLFVFQLSNNW